MANTGFQRSLTVTVDKTIAGVRQAGYPRTYYGRLEFSYGGQVYPEIDALTMSTMPVAIYNARLEAFKRYVESLEVGLNIDLSTVPGSEAYRQNLGACPIN